MTLSLPSLGWDDRIAAAYDPFDRPGRRPARVSRVEPGVCRLLDSEGACRASVGGALLATAAADSAALPCPGDWVVVCEWPDGRATVEAVLARHNMLYLAMIGEQPARVANLDTLAVVVPAGSRPGAATVAWLRSSGVVGAAPTVEVVDEDAGGLDRLRTFVSTGRTVGLVADRGAMASPARLRATPQRPGRPELSVLSTLAGVAVLPAGGLVPLPGGGTAFLVDFAADSVGAAPLTVAARPRPRQVARRRA